MNGRFNTLRFFFFAIVTIALLSSCSGKDENTEQCVPGETAPVDDGCNSCTCDDSGQFVCTNLNCDACTPGETKTGPEGCGQCDCNDQKSWECDLSTCSDCPLPKEHSCSPQTLYARNAENSQCCTYDSICAIPYETGLIFEDLESCSAVECTPGESTLEDEGCRLCACSGSGASECIDLPCSAKCMEGDQKDAQTWCNSCTCNADRLWDCTEEECPKECDPGDSKQADDNCNICACGPEQRWLCSENPCAPCEEGTTKIGYDGCNTCLCDSEGAWVCTDVFIVVESSGILGECPVCADGDLNTAYDECNSCVCDQSEADFFGRWECTQEPCAIGVCPNPVEHECATEPIFALNPGNNSCCSYDSPCALTQPWETFTTHSECACSTKEFNCSLQCGEAGYVKDSDGCDTCQCKCTDGDETYNEDTCEHCQCFSGNWTCNIAPCDAICTPGVIEPANDNCNTCVCTDEYEWFCTELDCTSPEDNICKPPAVNECEKKDFWGQTPTGKCCAYDSACSVPLSYPKFATLEECQNSTE